MKNRFFVLLLLFCVFYGSFAQHVTDRKEVDLRLIEKSTVIFTFGQSNSANHGQKRYQARHEVYNYYRGALYKAQDPLLGATGQKGSVWGLVGDQLIESGWKKPVTIIPIGVGGVEVGAWCKGGSCYTRLVRTLDDLKAKGIVPDCICWHQGESDNISNTPQQTYMERFLSIREEFRSRGFNAPFIIAVASYHPLCLEEDNGRSTEIREAQLQLARQYDDLFEGPDTDSLDKCYQRADGIHFSEKGQPVHAAMWVRAIRKVLEK